jgi:hypothetical protein
MKTFSIAALFFLPTLAFGQNLLDCASVTRDAAGNPLYKSQCTFNSFPEVSANYKGEQFEAYYTISLNASCGKTNTLIPIQFKAGGVVGSRQNFYLSKGEQTFTAQGIGPLSLIDELANLTKVQRLPPNCEVSLARPVEFRPTGPVIESWLTSAASYANRINSLNASLQRKSEILTYHEMYYGAADADREEVGSVLAEIRGQLDPSDPNVAIIDATLAGADYSAVVQKYEDLKSKLHGEISIAEGWQGKLVYGNGAESVALRTAITNATTTLNNG